MVKLGVLRHTLKKIETTGTTDGKTGGDQNTIEND